MGIFDSWGIDQTTGNNDPLGGLLTLSKKDKSGALGQALFQAGMGILSAKTGGNIGAAIGQGGMQGVQAYGSAIDDLKREKLQGYQMQHQRTQDETESERMARQDERQAKLDGFAETNANNQQTVFQQSQAKMQAMKDLAAKYSQGGRFDEAGYINELSSVDPDKAMEYSNMIKDREIKARQIAQGGQRAPYFTTVVGNNGNMYSFNSLTGKAEPLMVGGAKPDAPPPAGGATPPNASSPPPMLTPLKKPNFDTQLTRELAEAKATGVQGSDEIDAAIGAAQNIREVLASYDTLENAIANGASTGPISARFPTFNENTQQAEQALLGLSIPKTKQLGSNPTDKDAEIIRKSNLNANMSNEYLKKVLPDYRAAAQRSLASNEQYIELLKKGVSKAEAYKAVFGGSQGNGAFSGDNQQKKAVNWSDL
jgi:hypothetical protein